MGTKFAVRRRYRKNGEVVPRKIKSGWITLQVVITRSTTKICIKEDTPIPTFINPLAEQNTVFGYKVCAEYARTFCAFLAVSHTEKAPRNLILEAHPSLKWQLFFACAGIGR